VVVPDVPDDVPDPDPEDDPEPDDGLGEVEVPLGLDDSFGGVVDVPEPAPSPKGSWYCSSPALCANAEAVGRAKPAVNAQSAHRRARGRRSVGTRTSLRRRRTARPTQRCSAMNVRVRAL
jgi:hypothetical protein